MKILQRNLNRSTFVVWEMKRSVSVVRLIVATRSSGPPASQPVSCLMRLSADLSVIWLRVPTQYGCCSWVLVYVWVHTGYLENESIYSRGASVYCSHLLENRIDKVMSTAIPGDVWRPTSAEQVQHLGLAEETVNQGDFIGRAYRRSSKNVRGNNPKCEGRTNGVSQSHCADFHRNQGCLEALAIVLRKKRSFMRTVSPWSTN